MKDKQILIKLSSAEKDQITQLMKFNNFENMSGYIRWVLASQYKKQIEGKQ